MAEQSEQWMRNALAKAFRKSLTRIEDQGIDPGSALYTQLRKRGWTLIPIEDARAFYNPEGGTE